MFDYHKQKAKGIEGRALLRKPPSSIACNKNSTIARREAKVSIQKERLGARSTRSRRKQLRCAKYIKSNTLE